MKYDVALSFAGEDRAYVANVAKELKKQKISVFYDEYEMATLWGKDLYQHLSNIYSEMARFTVVFISRNYANKLWARHELRAAQARAVKHSEEYILPARFDDTDLPGLINTTGYIDLKKTTTNQLARLIIEKLERAQPTFEFAHKIVDEKDLTEERRYLLSVDLDSSSVKNQHVIFNLEAYSTFDEILNDLFIHYLKDKVRPFSYGREWILITAPFNQRIIAPLDWILNWGKAISEIDITWTKKIELEETGIARGQYLSVNYMKFPLSKKVYGVLTNNDRVASVLNTKAKAIAFLGDILEPCKNISSDLRNSYRHHLVYSDWLSVVQSPFLIDVGKPIDENIFERFEDR